jgi:hypothetical protein
VDFKSVAYLEVAVKTFLYDYQRKPEIARDYLRKAIDDGIEFTFPCNGDGEVFRKKLLEGLNE